MIIWIMFSRCGLSLIFSYFRVKRRKMACGLITIVLLLTLYTDSVLTECSSDCASCSGSTCSNCNSSYYLSSGSCSPCPEQCTACNSYDLCTACKPGRWGSDNQCQFNCADSCYKRECQYDTGNCIRCKNGLYGPQCQYNCSDCEGNLCDLRGCTNGCKQGYYEYITELESICHACPSDCRYCNDAQTCRVCNEDFHLFQFQSNGKLYVHCAGCIYGANCSSYCYIQNCKTCLIQNEALVCQGCPGGYRFNGFACIANTTSCSQGCSTHCDDDGICLGMCNAGWTGNKCSVQCSVKCLTCDKSNGDICQKCKGDFYTTKCSVACSPSCKAEEGNQTCGLYDAYCLNGCKHNVWGPDCNQSCSSGCLNTSSSSTVCERNNGTCKQGCKDGYNGAKCDTTSMSTTTTTLEDTLQSSPASPTPKSGSKKENSNLIIIGSAAGGGALVLILVIVFIVCLVKRRRKPTGEESLHNGMILSNDKANEKVNLEDHVQVPGKEDYIYAQPAKDHMEQKHSKTDISKSHRMYDNMSIDLEKAEVTVTENETDVDKIQLEELDEGPTKFIETDVKPPCTDFYYNTASLIRSRIHVSDLQEYIKKKTDYAKEFEKLPKGLIRTCDEALKQNNRAKNRYNGIYAYDATRVVLQSKNYINANYIDGHKASPAYIASLGPTKSTMSDFQDFWEMIWQERTDKIIMLTNLEESKKMKCEKYWPDQGGTKKYGNFKVTSKAEKKFTEFTVRELTMDARSETRLVIQYHYTAWPDKSVPDGVATLLEFRDKVEQSQTANAGPMVVHCSAGIGRTGTYIALDCLIKEGKDEDSVDIFGCVMALRGQRAHMVQNLDQYIYLHLCTLYALTCDAEPLSLTSIANVMTDEKIIRQYEIFTDIHLPMDKKSKKGNRSGTDNSCDDHRVRLTLEGHGNITAIYVNGYEKSKKFILTQTPLPDKVEDFLSMLFQEKCQLIVCLDEENMKDKTVGHYLPHDDKVYKFGHFQVACTTCDSTEDYVVREMKISRNEASESEELKIKHYQFKGWTSSERVPSRVEPFLKMVEDVENNKKVQKSEQPIVVHCLTGAERCGLFCVVSLLSEKLHFEKEISVLNTICQVRTRRRSAFNDIECFRFCYRCVEEMSQNSDSSIYYNMMNM